MKSAPARLRQCFAAMVLWKAHCLGGDNVPKWILCTHIFMAIHPSTARAEKAKTLHHQFSHQRFNHHLSVSAST